MWALHEWRNWLTPTTAYEKRFNTAFYLTCMPDVPHAEYENVEMEDLKVRYLNNSSRETRTFRKN